MTHSHQYDAIVIGSGIGGLTAAALLSKFNRKKVLILEQHFVVGGFIQEFSHAGFRWDIGVQAVEGVAKGDIGRAVFDYITDGKLQWKKLPDPYEKLVYPDFTFEIDSNREHYITDLIDLFPAETSNLKQYFFDLKKAVLWYGIYLTVQNAPQWFQEIAQPWVRRCGTLARLTTQEYLDRHFQDPRLKALLTSQWIGYGLPPAQSSFGIHALVSQNWGKGSWYPVGGSQAITDCILPTIERAGGTVLLRQRVTEIMVEKGTAIGVRTQKAHDGTAEIEEYYAPVIISDAGAVNTYTKLLREDVDIGDRHPMRSFPKGYSMLILFLGLNASPATLGFEVADYWIYSGYDHDRALQEQLSKPEKILNSCILSFPSLKSPTAQHTAEITIFAEYDYFAQWQSQPWRKRDTDYYELKEKISQCMIDFVEQRYPGFKTSIECYELATPLTMEYFDLSDKGAAYGIPWVPERFDQRWIGAKTPIKNLYLTGADALIHGIVGALMAGVMTSGLANGGFGFLRIMFAIGRESIFCPSKPSQKASP
jgi:all-trans-retinol 13,14-reductase